MRKNRNGSRASGSGTLSDSGVPNGSGLPSSAAALNGGHAGGDDAILSVRELAVEYRTALGKVRALNGVTFDVRRGRVLGVVGESGSGKSVTARAILQILERQGHLTEGSIVFHPGKGDSGEKLREVHPDQAAATTDSGGIDLTRLGPTSDAMRAIRGAEIAMIFQEPMSSLNPVYTVGAQIQEAILLHQNPDKKESWVQAVEMLRQVGMPNPERIATSYPHQLSGGMRQRAMIAMALALEPQVLIMDEPTTALDVVMQRQIVEEITRLRDRLGFAVIFITHDVSLLIEIADRIAIMYAGEIVEEGTAPEVYRRPRHPYTRGLLTSFPPLHGPRRELGGIAGSPPDLQRLPRGCPFADRCAFAFDRCRAEVPPLAPTAFGDTEPGRMVACHLHDRTAAALPAELAVRP
jgi:oligopeptide/dipeptide ABC transporter ATP-binding protein